MAKVEEKATVAFRVKEAMGIAAETIRQMLPLNAQKPDRTPPRSDHPRLLYAAIRNQRYTPGHLPSDRDRRNDNGNGGCVSLAMTLVLGQESLPAGWQGKGIRASRVSHMLERQAKRQGLVVEVVTTVHDLWDALRRKSARGALLMQTQDSGHHLVGIAPSGIRRGGVPARYYVADMDPEQPDNLGDVMVFGENGLVDTEKSAKRMSQRVVPPVYATRGDNIAHQATGSETMLVLRLKKSPREPVDYFFRAQARSARKKHT